MEILAGRFTNKCESEDEEHLYLRLLKNGRKRKLERKVSKYKDKKGIIEKEQKEAVDWFIDMCKREPEKFNKVRAICYTDAAKHNSKSRRAFIKSGDYFVRKMNSIIVKNKYTLNKKRKFDGMVYFYTDDIMEFLTLLYASYNENKLFEFVDVPDVSYILRQIKKTGIEIYLKKKKIA